jgi:uncharacterized protein with ParB-like and HNH nuclease domain
MKAYARSIFHLFDGKRRYIVPLFQRQYVWNREKQWEPLWEDISRVAERRWENQTGPPHFLGAMVLDQIRTYGNQVPAHLIIDGQQRLTTFQIIMAALRQVAGSVDASDFADEVQRYLENTGIMENRDEERFKMWPSRVDQEAFKLIVDSTSPKEMESYYEKNSSILIRGYQFFHGAVNDYVMSGDAKRRVENLYQVLRQDLEVVSIELDGDDDPQVIFETLNARGEALLPSDLLRNFLFWRASRRNENKDVLYERYWLPFDQKFWKQEERLGRLKRPRIDIFMQHFLECQEGQEINIGRLFHEYKKWINETNPFDTVEAELKSLTSYAAVFRKLIEANPEALPYGLFFWRLKQIDVGTIYPLLLYILNHPDQGEQNVAGMLSDLESYLFRRLICGLTPKNYNRIFLQLIRNLIKDGFTQESLRKSLLSMRGEAGVWPDDISFGEAWTSRNVYLEIKPAHRIVVVLRAIEDALRQEKNERMLIQSPLTIEHIMPQSWEKTWPLSDGTYVKDRFSRIVEGIRNSEADERDSLLHTFGNLTLLTHPLNSAVSNARWEEKRPEICKQSALSLNRNFQDYPNWDVGEIRNRSRWFFDIAKGVWSYPAV